MRTRSRLNHHRGQSDVPIDLQAVDALDGCEAMFKGVSVHPIGHDPEGVTLAADCQLRDKERGFRCYHQGATNTREYMKLTVSGGVHTAA